jgi:hypothetical protein
MQSNDTAPGAVDRAAARFLEATRDALRAEISSYRVPTLVRIVTGAIEEAIPAARAGDVAQLDKLAADMTARVAAHVRAANR